MEPGDSLAASLERLPGVLAGTVFLEPPAGPRVYLAVGADADRETLRAAVMEMLQDHGVPCSPERIHLASPPRPATSSAVLPRATLDDIEVHRQGGQTSCTVRLRAAARHTTGTATEPDTPAGRGRAAARATLQAAEELDPDLRLGLEGARITELFASPAVVLLIEATAGRSHAHLPGVALVERSVEEAASLAVLGALRSWTA